MKADGEQSSTRSYNGLFPYINSIYLAGVLRGRVNWRVFSAAEADFLTLSYLHHPQRVLDLIRQSVFLAQDQDQADMLFTLLELFAPGMVDAPSMHWITPLDRAMRRSIHALFCDFDTRSVALNLITPRSVCGSITVRARWRFGLLCLC